MFLYLLAYGFSLATSLNIFSNDFVPVRDLVSIIQDGIPEGIIDCGLSSSTVGTSLVKFK